jgi:hypothetical protein
MLLIETEPQVSWLREFLFPALFVILGALIGAVLTYFTAQLSDDRKAKRAKDSFLRAIGMELDALSDQLDASYHEVKGSTARVQGGGVGPQFAATLRTSVFSSQIGKLRDVDDPLAIEVVHFYSDLGTLQQIFESANEQSAEVNRAGIGVDVNVSLQVIGLRGTLLSTLKVLLEQIYGFCNRLNKLRAKLPPAEQPK